MDEYVQCSIFTQNFNPNAYIQLNYILWQMFSKVWRIDLSRSLPEKFTKGYISKIRKLNLERKHRMLSSLLCLGMKYEEESMKSYCEETTNTLLVKLVFSRVVLSQYEQWPQSHLTVNFYKQIETVLKWKILTAYLERIKILPISSLWWRNKSTKHIS